MPILTWGLVLAQSCKGVSPDCGMCQQAGSNSHAMRSPPGGLCVGDAFLSSKVEQGSRCSSGRFKGEVLGQREVGGPSLAKAL